MLYIKPVPRLIHVGYSVISFSRHMITIMAHINSSFRLRAIYRRLTDLTFNGIILYFNFNQRPNKASWIRRLHDERLPRQLARISKTTVNPHGGYKYMVSLCLKIKYTN